MPAQRKYPDELRERAVKMVLESQCDPDGKSPLVGRCNAERRIHAAGTGAGHAGRRAQMIQIWARGGLGAGNGDGPAGALVSSGHSTAARLLWLDEHERVALDDGDALGALAYQGRHELQGVAG
jgi:hypothetical protein